MYTSQTTPLSVLQQHTAIGDFVHHCCLQALSLLGSTDVDRAANGGNLHDAVTLPEGEDANEWLAVNTIDFYSAISLLYGVVAEFCTEVRPAPPPDPPRGAARGAPS